MISYNANGITTGTFLTREELRELTGRCFKSQQIQHLKKMGVAFRVNAIGHPVVTRSSIEGSSEPAVSKKWTPNAMRGK